MNTSFNHTSNLAAPSDPSAEVIGTSSPEASSQAPRNSARSLVAFFTTVFASMAAAAAVVSNDIPLMVVGL